MFTRSLVIQKRVEDLQLGVESYQKKINVTKPKTTKPDIRKRDPYTSYQDPQGFIYVDNLGRNRLMRSDKLYKFSDRTLSGLRTSLDDLITKKSEGLKERRDEEEPQKDLLVEAQRNLPHRLTQNRRDLPRDIPLDSVEVLRHFYQLSHSELDGIEKVAVCSSFRSLKLKRTIESRAKRDHP
ncbi:hypothetical protein Tco_0319913 [Tanacetum coccineum]